MQSVVHILSGEVAERRWLTVYKLATSPHGRLSVAARNLYLAYAAAYGVN